MSKDCWLDIHPDSDFSIHNLPFGIFSTSSRLPRVGMAIGDYIVDLAAANKIGLFEDLDLPEDTFYRNYLNSVISLGKKKSYEIRKLVQAQLCDESSTLKEYNTLLVKQKNAQMHMPVDVGDYTDFYSSLEHATNVGQIFRDADEPLLPNWRHMPVAYHGRSSSLVIDGSDIYRPWGQIVTRPGHDPEFSPSKQLDFELEMGYIVGKSSERGTPVKADEAGDYLFGMVMLNDWSARDIQKWEYIPLGPFLGKNFTTSISPWVVTMDALQPFRIAGPEQEPKVLPHLQTKGELNLDLNLEVSLKPADSDEETVCRSNSKHLYWNINQKIAHHTSNGCNLRIGDLIATGTISGSDPGTYGSLLELTHAGAKPMSLRGGSVRSFLEDGDQVTMRGYGKINDKRVGFGRVGGRILPAIR